MVQLSGSASPPLPDPEPGTQMSLAVLYCAACSVATPPQMWFRCVAVTLAPNSQGRRYLQSALAKRWVLLCHSVSPGSTVRTKTELLPTAMCDPRHILPGSTDLAWTQTLCFNLNLQRCFFYIDLHMRGHTPLMITPLKQLVASSYRKFR